MCEKYIEWKNNLLSSDKKNLPNLKMLNQIKSDTKCKSK